MNKKEMGITVKGLIEYAEICMDNENYQELSNVLDIAFSIACAWDLKEIDEVDEACKSCRIAARVQISEDMKRIEKEIAKLSKLKEAYAILQD